MLVHEIRLQGKAAGETLLDAAIVGHYGTPVVLVTGADDVCREARADLGDRPRDGRGQAGARARRACASLTPKRSAGADPRGRRAGGARARAAQALDDAAARSTMDVEFHRREMATRALDTGARRRRSDRCVRYVGADVPDAVRAVWRGLEEALREDGGFLSSPTPSPRNEEGARERVRAPLGCWPLILGCCGL